MGGIMSTEEKRAEIRDILDRMKAEGQKAPKRERPGSQCHVENNSGVVINIAADSDISQRLPELLSASTRNA